MSPEFIAFIVTKTACRRPAAAALNFATTGLSSSSFSGETTIVSVTAFFAGSVAVVVVDDLSSSFLELLT